MNSNEKMILRHLEHAEKAIEATRELLMQGKARRALHKLHDIVQEAKAARAWAFEEDAQRVLQALEAKR